MGSLYKGFDQATAAGTIMGRIRLEEVTSTNLTTLKDINQKIFPILTVTDMSANQWSQFIKRDVHNIISYVRNDNKAAIHINQKFGFGITSNDKRDPSLFVMEKMLHINNPAPASA